MDYSKQPPSGATLKGFFEITFLSIMSILNLSFTKKLAIPGHGASSEQTPGGPLDPH